MKEAANTESMIEVCCIGCISQKLSLEVDSLVIINNNLMKCDLSSSYAVLKQKTFPCIQYSL